MQFDVVKIVISIDLAEYHEAYAGQALHVWVNPPRAKKKHYEKLLRDFALATARQKNINDAEALRAETETLDGLLNTMYAYRAELWSQGADASTHWTVEEITTIYEADPAFLRWMIERTDEAMREFRGAAKKK